MRSLRDTTHALDAGLARIRQQYSVPDGFPPEVLAAADEASKKQPTAHVDRTDWDFVTLDPASSTDLDQAFTISRSGTDLVLHYAIADVAWFVIDGDVVDAEAWRRGSTLYLPDGRESLYPAVLSESAVSLLPDGPRPAVVFHVRLDTEGRPSLDGVERCIIRNRAKLGYETVTLADLPADFSEFAARVEANESVRGAGRVDPPEQLVEREGRGYRLVFRPRQPTEAQNAALSASTNIAVAEALQTACTGLFRVMPAPDQRAVARLRLTANAFGMRWPKHQPLDEYARTLDSNDPRHAAFMLAVRRTPRMPLMWCRGTPRWRPRTHTPPRHCDVSPIAMWSSVPWRWPTDARCPRRCRLRCHGCPGRWQRPPRNRRRSIGPWSIWPRPYCCRATRATHSVPWWWRTKATSAASSSSTSRWWRSCVPRSCSRATSVE